ncbi:MAG: hypothetical protein LBT42_04510, partial [Tannerella sp.]|nr:hypothetical protein [Tannerella sp.]
LSFLVRQSSCIRHVDRSRDICLGIKQAVSDYRCLRCAPVDMTEEVNVIARKLLNEFSKQEE